LNYAWFVDGPETKTWMNRGGAPLPFYPGPVAPGSVRVFRHPSLEGVRTRPGTMRRDSINALIQSLICVLSFGSLR
jgi:hypothetical protein